MPEAEKDSKLTKLQQARYRHVDAAAAAAADRRAEVEAAKEATKAARLSMVEHTKALQKIEGGSQWKARVRAEAVDMAQLGMAQETIAEAVIARLCNPGMHPHVHDRWANNIIAYVLHDPYVIKLCEETRAAGIYRQLKIVEEVVNMRDPETGRLVEPRRSMDAVNLLLRYRMMTEQIAVKVTRRALNAAPLEDVEALLNELDQTTDEAKKVIDTTMIGAPGPRLRQMGRTKASIDVAVVERRGKHGNSTNAAAIAAKKRNAAERRRLKQEAAEAAMAAAEEGDDR